MEEITLVNQNLKVVILTYGGIIKELWFDGVNVVLGNERPQEYLDNPWCLGACIGRFAGRLATEYFVDGKEYSLKGKNNIQLHGGEQGWDKRTWKVTDIYHGIIPHVTLELLCPEKENSHPGDVHVSLKYSLHKNKLSIEYKATSNKPTPINITNHSYFKLSEAPNLEDHELAVYADEVLELDENLLPTGTINPVENTDFDRNHLRLIGSSRYDDCFVLREKEAVNASLRCNTTKIQMDVSTDQPGVVIFNPKELGGICFETQKFSNGPNITRFPNTILRPGERYTQKTQFSFLKF